ncbi:hypothetical protein ACQBJO_08190 [Janibacter sp. G349]|nr:hypothetical protein [Janibacter sp. CX7]
MDEIEGGEAGATFVVVASEDGRAVALFSDGSWGPAEEFGLGEG